ncbi:hypothetical protein QRD02_03560 [Aequorivita sp. SDUM287046]|uniref:DUF4258 domain-containing protein n=1 Tax=Aequorivita aurantiaca TaxID=3053356 RepID=A0ABT8DF91_9FLAO|nr:hypothetical protein [Aequorivita aurantiaca]MDN3723447.1 hypothetical protein [Aequorivita aurantiaca]
MKLAYRLAYFSGGFIIGIALLIFILSGKKTSCSYGLDARTLKNIRLKDRVFSEKSITSLRENNLDTAAVSYLLEHGDVVFSESNTKLDSCKQYVIVGTFAEKNLKIKVENCDTLATVLEANLYLKH